MCVCVCVCMWGRSGFSEGRMCILTPTGREYGGGENGEMLVKEYKLPFIRQVSSGDLMYSMVTIINNTALYTSKLLRE